MSYKINRRYFLSSSGLMLTLPLLESLSPYTRALAAVPAVGRAVWLYMPNGTYNRTNDAPWHPATGKLTTNLPDVLSPFANRIADFSVLKNIRNASRDATDLNYYNFNKNGGGHVSAVSSFLSSQVINTPGSTACSISRPSVDQIIAQKSGKKSLVLHMGPLTSGADSSPFDYSNYISFNGGKPFPPLYNPHDVYKQLLGMVAPGSTTTPTAPALNQAKKSMLDQALTDLNDLKSKLGRTDQAKLDDYLTSVRSLETKLAGSGGGGTATCTAPGAPSANLNNYGGNNLTDFQARAQAYFDMIAFAFSCDLARSVAFMFDGETGERIMNAQVPANLVFSGGAMDAGMHIGIAHLGGRPKNVTKDRFYMYLMFYLVDKLKSMTDTNGSPILDNTIIHLGYGVYAGDHGNGTPPVVLAGGRSLINPGSSYDVGAYDQKDLLFTIASKMNLGITAFEGSSKIVPI